ncbi:MAG: hypothetical protein KF830_09360 [Planctomycetes bacterium]|nr:hypothetical protein [Planctomycetota bacterium]
MSAKLCIALALTVLFLALAVGNPFLPAVAGGPPVGVGPEHGRVPLLPLRLAPTLATRPACPDPDLEDLVVEVRIDAHGEPVWVLRDGRTVRRDDALAADSHR